MNQIAEMEQTLKNLKNEYNKSTGEFSKLEQPLYAFFVKVGKIEQAIADAKQECG